MSQLSISDEHRGQKNRTWTLDPAFHGGEVIFIDHDTDTLGGFGAEGHDLARQQAESLRREGLGVRRESRARQTIPCWVESRE